jgi:hypothetical protein
VRALGNCISLTYRRGETAELMMHRHRETPAKLDLFGRAIREPGGSLNAGCFRQGAVRAWLGTATRRNRPELAPSGCRRCDRRL